MVKNRAKIFRQPLPFQAMPKRKIFKIGGCPYQTIPDKNLDNFSENSKQPLIPQPPPSFRKNIHQNSRLESSPKKRAGDNKVEIQIQLFFTCPCSTQGVYFWDNLFWPVQLQCNSCSQDRRSRFQSSVTWSHIYQI